jgi:hypothetical protein
MSEDYGKFGKLIWEAADKFDFLKVQASRGVLGRDHVVLQFALMHKGKHVVHSEILSLEAIKSMSDPKVVIDAIHKRLVTSSPSS